LDVLWKIIFVITLSVLFSIEKKSVIWFICNLGWKKREYIKFKLERLYKKLWLRLKWQLLLCLFIAIAMLIALIIMSIFGLEIPQKWSLAVIAWLTELIPYIGPILWWIPAVIVVLLHNWIYAAIVMVGVIFIIQWLENNILIPVVMNKTLWVNPVTIFISMILWWIIMWFIWILLAVPIAVILTIFLWGRFESDDK
jgi:predicted PurR-regulated permease PerM